jgi:CBS domain-containing protein
MRIESLMTREVRTCSADDSLNRAAQVMWDTDTGFLPVVDREAHVVGVVTDRDLLMGAYTQGRCLFDASVDSVMARDVVTCSPDDDVARVELLMQEKRIRRIPVVGSSGELAGVVTLGDLARASQKSALKKAFEGVPIARTLAAICDPRAPAAANAAE